MRSEIKCADQCKQPKEQLLTWNELEQFGFNNGTDAANTNINTVTNFSSKDKDTLG